MHMYVYTALNVTRTIDCYRVGAVPKHSKDSRTFELGEFTAMLSSFFQGGRPKMTKKSRV